MLRHRGWPWPREKEHTLEFMALLVLLVLFSVQCCSCAQCGALYISSTRCCARCVLRMSVGLGVKGSFMSGVTEAVRGICRPSFDMAGRASSLLVLICYNTPVTY